MKRTKPQNLTARSIYQAVYSIWDKMTLDILTHAYKERCTFYGWEENAHQLKALEVLSSLYSHRHHRPSFLQRWFHKPSPNTPLGVYLHGHVGRGKTMIMDLFFTAYPSPHKARWHYDAFMQHIHQDLKNAAKGNFSEQPIRQVATHWGKSYQLLCIDEFQVNDIADAMILSRLFEDITRAGCLIVTTSNLAPDHLYRGGLHYERFQPFVSFLKKFFRIHSLNGEMDYRQQPYHGEHLYFTPHNKDTEALCRSILDGRIHQPLTKKTFSVHQREWSLLASEGHVWASFKELCEKPLGAADYQALVEETECLYLLDIPLLTPDKIAPARRLVQLIDALYDQKYKEETHTLVATAESLPHELNQTRDATLPFERTLSRLMALGTVKKSIKF